MVGLDHGGCDRARRRVSIFCEMWSRSEWLLVMLAATDALDMRCCGWSVSGGRGVQRRRRSSPSGRVVEERARRGFTLTDAATYLLLLGPRELQFLSWIVENPSNVCGRSAHIMSAPLTMKREVVGFAGPPVAEYDHPGRLTRSHRFARCLTQCQRLCIVRSSESDLRRE